MTPSETPTPSVRSSVRPWLDDTVREVAVFLLFLLLAIQFTWPLIQHLPDAVSDPGDPFLNTWILDWVMHAAVNPVASLWDGPIFYPARLSLAFSENLIGIALIMAPFRAAGMSPLEIYNLALILGFAFSGFGGYVLCRLVTKSTFAGIIGGLLYGFTLSRFHQIPHLQHVWGGWLPIFLAALIYYRRSPSWTRALLFGAAFVINGLTNLHWFAFGSFAIAVTFAAMFAIDSQPKKIRRWTPLIVATLLAILCMIPVLLPYREAGKLYGFKRGKGESTFYSATWNDWLIPAPQSRLYGGLPLLANRKDERALFPGLSILILAGIGLLSTWRHPSLLSVAAEPPERRLPSRARLRILDGVILLLLLLSYFGAVSERVDWRVGDLRVLTMSSADVPFLLALLAVFWRLWLRLPEAWGGAGGSSLRSFFERAGKPAALWIGMLWAALGVLGSLGMNAFFHTALFRLEPFHGIRVPARWAFIAIVGLAMLASLGALALTRGQRKWARLATMALLAITCWADLQVRLVWTPVLRRTPDVYKWLARTPVRGAVVELPMETWFAFEYLYRATGHRRPLMNGASGFETKLHAELYQASIADPIPADLLVKFERNGCSLVIVHADLLPNQPQVREWLKRELREGRLAFVQRFEHDVHGDFVFAVTRNEPEWYRWKLTQARDGAGQTPGEDLQGFLAGSMNTYNRTPFGLLERPRNGEEVRGEMDISGWAFSPDGIARVDILFRNGRVKLPAVLEPRPEISAMFPGYSNNPTPGYLLHLTRRPKNVPLETDIQVEVTDGKGRKERLRGSLFFWYRGKAAGQK